ncbi:MAG: PH domain-containing protein [Pseudonocardiaceae bacterium]
MLGHQANVLLSPDVERRVIRVRRHWAVLLKDLLITVAVILGVYLLSRLIGNVADGLWLVQSLLWYVAVAALLRFAWKVLEWWIEVFIITDKRFMVTQGIIRTKNGMMPITKVTDLTFARPFIGQLLGYGTLHVESAGQVQGLDVIEFVPEPEEVFMAISELVFGDKKQPRSHMLAPPRSPRRRRWPRTRLPGSERR